MTSTGDDKAGAGDAVAADQLGGIFRGPSVASVLAANKGLGPGFDLCRIGLSLLVMLVHSSLLEAPKSGELEGWLHPFVAAILPLFFGLSGFLVTGSAIRLRNLRTFLTFRVLRIMPALVVEVSLSAIVLGSLMTTWTHADYYADPRFYTYFGNIVGWIHFQLPGMFEHNPFPNTVNGNLWTLHPEFLCYGILGAAIAIKAVYSRTLMTSLWAAATIVGLVLNLWFGTYELGFRFGGTILVYYFITGVAAFHWRDRIPVNTTLFVCSCIVAYVILSLPHAVFLVQIPLIYIMMWMGMQKFPHIALLQRGDYSYGIYLYGYPIQQTFIALFPGLAKWWIIFPVSLVLTFAVAAMSWHFIEKPALRLKKFVLRPAPSGAVAAAA